LDPDVLIGSSSVDEEALEKRVIEELPAEEVPEGTRAVPQDWMVVRGADGSVRYVPLF
jgi:hypothetical protein